MSEWKKCSLGDVINLKRGYDLPSRERLTGQYPIVSSSGISGFHKEAMVKAPGVVTGRYGTIGEVFYITQDFWPLNTSLYVQSFKGNNPRFISYFLKTLDLGSQNVAGAVPGVNRNALHMLSVSIPSLLIQKKIVAVLSTYDDLIENNDRRITLLEKMAEEIYREWFVRLRFPGFDRATFYKGIPEGWEYVELGGLLDIQHGYAFKGEFFSQEPTTNILLTPGNFAIGGGYKDDKLKYYNGSIPEGYILKTGDMIVTMTDLSKAGDTLGYPAFVPPSQQYQFLHNQRLGKVIIHNRNIVGSHFLYHVFCSELYRYHVVGSATGSTVKHTAPERIKSFQTLLPDQALMQEFEQQIDAIRNQIVLLNRKNSVLKQTRDRLLTRLISGKLSVEDLDIQFPPSMTTDS
jgi:type I restriction enzyme, S subunit